MIPDTGSDERRAALETRAAANTPAALVTQILTAVRELTIVPVPGADPAARGESALFFPVVGLALGGVLLGVSALVGDVVTPRMRGALLLAVLLGLTGGRHALGLARAASAPSGGSAAPVRVRGAALAAGVLALTALALGALRGGALIAGVLFAPALARWSMVAFAFGARPARGATAADRVMCTIKFREFAGASVIALGVTLSYTEVWGLVVILAIGVVAIGARVIVHQWWGGVTRPLVDALGVCNEALALAVFALGGP
jgi:adenosylcobinamide-GDP ribazoletransferase